MEEAHFSCGRKALQRPGDGRWTAIYEKQQDQYSYCMAEYMRKDNVNEAGKDFKHQLK